MNNNSDTHTHTTKHSITELRVSHLPAPQTHASLGDRH